MFGYFKRKKAKAEAEKARLINDSSLRAREVLHLAIDNVRHDEKYTLGVDDVELMNRLFQALKNSAKSGVDEVLLRNGDPFGEEIKLLGDVAVGSGMIANGIRNEFILLGGVDYYTVEEKISFQINRFFEQFMDQTLQQ